MRLSCTALSSWIGYGQTIYRDPEKLPEALVLCGCKPVEGGLLKHTGVVITGHEARCVVIEAFKALGGTEGGGAIYVTRRHLEEHDYSNLADFVQQNFLCTMPVVEGPYGIGEGPAASGPEP